MAEAAATEPTHAQMIAEMQKAGYAPPAVPTDPTHEQMIKEMSAAGFAPQSGPQSPQSYSQLADISSLKVENQKPVLTGNDVVQNAPAIGAAIGGYGGALTPIPGAAEVGAGGVAAIGSVIKDNINNYFNGGTKSAKDITGDAAIEGGTAAATQLAGGVLLKGAGKVLGSIAEQTVPRAVIERYKTAADAVKSLISSSKGDIAEAATTVKEGIQTSLDEFRSNMNAKLGLALKDSTERINPASIIEELKAAKARISADVSPGAHAEIDDFLSRINKLRDENGQIFVQDANSLKQELQDKATAAYREAGQSGKGTQVENAFKAAGARTRGLLNKAVPNIAEANDKLAALHEIEDNMNKSLIQDGKGTNAMVKAGEYSPGHPDGNPDSAKALRDLGKITGEDYIGQTQNLAAMKSFSGSSLYRKGAGVALGAAGGAGVAEIAGGDPYKGAFVGGTLGGALTSPAAIKFGIDASKYVPAAPAVQSLGQAVMHGSGAMNAIRGNRP